MIPTRPRLNSRVLVAIEVADLVLSTPTRTDRSHRELDGRSEQLQRDQGIVHQAAFAHSHSSQPRLATHPSVSIPACRASLRVPLRVLQASLRGLRPFLETTGPYRHRRCIVEENDRRPALRLQNPEKPDRSENNVCERLNFCRGFAAVRLQGLEAALH